MKPENITLISFGYFEKRFLGEIMYDVEREFRIPVIVREGYLDLSLYFDPARRQYNGNRLLQDINQQFASDETKTLAVFNVDLYIPILTFIFGQAFLNGRCGIASAYRLRNERYGIAPNEPVFVDRLRKEVIHELGHAFGLIHCLTPTCVMRSSTYVEDIDQKGWSFCPKCRKQLEG
ncbi:archaemetzincin family Zn-dependent metalloprotease [uncultured Sunxiuqinia sp.]|uniref:archaemetzincin family Zn-dependent metalloprotease n=1 Tax=Sunxiuqinia rutila TaxID=1397841 RepID=UPI002617EB21|nr:archaemetzincin family Zn-dependent metalloprotease [uncultured Sunxiuqinia sp.]